MPANDYDIQDSWKLDPVNKSVLYAQMLNDLPAGLSEWAVHPGIDNSELLTLEPDGYHFRQTDYDYWTSHQAKDTVKENGIILMDYRALQDVLKET